MHKSFDNENYTISLLSQLIEIPTINPPGEKYDEICSKIQSILESLGMDIRIVEGRKDKPNIIGEIGNDRPILLFNGHLDVVPPGIGWKTDPFKATEKGGRIYGRGTADMKSGLVSMIAAIKAVLDEGTNLKGKLIYTATVDEETGGFDGMGYLIRKEGIKADYCLSGEGSNLNICRCQKGVYWCKISVKGKAAHGGVPECGVNAIEKMFKIISGLQSISFEKEHEILGKPTVNIGKIMGGTKINVVPDHCEILVDRRSLPGESPTEVKKGIISAIESVRKKDLQLNFKVDDLLIAEPFDTSENEGFFKVALKAVEEALNKKPKITGLHGFTDARFPAVEQKLPSIIIGPGDIKQAHTANEYVERKQILDATAIYYTLIKKLLT